jgi:hypothetical protein
MADSGSPRFFATIAATVDSQNSQWLMSLTTTMSVLSSNM